MEKESRTSHNLKFVNDFNNNTAMKINNRENTLIGFIMKETARCQDCDILISKLKTELQNYSDNVLLLEFENEVREELLREKKEEIEKMEIENEKLKALLEQRRKSVIVAHTYNNNHCEVISTFHNVVASPKNLVNETDCQLVVSTTSDDPVEITKPKCKLIRNSSRKIKDFRHLPNIVYNLRKRAKAQKE